MEKPNKEKYGWVDKNSFDDEPAGWALEGGEDAYYEALELWENDAEKCPDCFDRGWIYNDEDGTRKVCPCHLK